MMATATKAKTKTATMPTTRAEAARQIARDRADRIAKMTPAKRRAMIADMTKTLNESAPTMEAAGSDLLGVLMAVGLEFIKKYYPDATGATFHVSSYARHTHDWSAVIPVPVPEQGE